MQDSKDSVVETARQLSIEGSVRTAAGASALAVRYTASLENRAMLEWTALKEM
jgi:hypothetical protein